MKTAVAVLLSTTIIHSVEATATTMSHTNHRRLDMEGAVTDAGYDSYATAWRYLGAYIDCNGSSSSFFSGVSSRFKSNCKYCNRALDALAAGNSDGGGDGGRDLASCKNPTRKLLWAAYYDPYYGGNQIGEYQFYVNNDDDDEDGGGGGEWDDSTCVGNRCSKMDCHEHGSSWKLMGVYKETVSFDDDNFYEQLFKHQGYCLWDGDKEDNDYDSQDSDAWESGSTYGFMQTMRKELPEGCTKTSVFSDGTYYVDMKPQSGGDMTLGVYKDSKCTEESHYTYEDYQSYASSSLTASASSGAFDTWNAGMDAYKVCQPCRAYNREETERGDDWSEDRDRRQRGRRRLTEYNDGQGDEEKNGFNCYDDAGYQNCNQCYKFETHSDMEEAYASDLSHASAQGTILQINYDGVWYGKGTVGSSSSYSSSSSSSEQSSGGRKSTYGSSRYQWQYSRTSYSFGGAAMAMLAVGWGGGGARTKAAERGTLDDDVQDNGTYVEMAAPQ
eukprot:CAMPEP_0181121968 /NCGR_PEP_ID=MMETSP1071-20121207/25042_1 /TAXON_ID=35127 /ORGANISM="Thalassiosira sp., Strain NH16" /LENGTH=498 /DNA_ID=CAMNT_0023206865 /DNA_START=101 /DNA_END=1598 /DNA_ORIENTATION=-